MVLFFKAGGAVPRLLGRVHYDSDSAHSRLFDAELGWGTAATVEAGYAFRGDSLFVEFHLNGEPVFLDSGRFFLPRQRLISNYVEKTDSLVSPFRISEMQNAVERLYPRPVIAVARKDSMEGGRLHLFLQPFSPGSKGERLTAVHWRLRRLHSPDIPFFDELTEDPGWFYHLKIPMFAGPDTLFYTARFRNNFGNYGDWAQACTLIVSPPQVPFFSVDSVYFTGADRAGDTAILKSGKWNRIRFTVNSHGRSWGQLGFFMVTLSDTHYLFGNTLNKGGEFRKNDNYPFNLSFQNDSVGWKLFERRQMGTLISTMIHKDTLPLTLDSDPSELVTDTAQGIFGFRFRLLQDAKPGIWNIRIFAVSGRNLYFKNQVDSLSVIFTIPVIVKPNARPRMMPLFIFFTAMAVLLILPFFLRKRRVGAKSSAAPLPADSEEFQRICDFLNSAYSDPELSVEKVRGALGIGRNRMNQLLRQNKISSIPNKINDIRIEKAKGLLRNTTKTVSEVAFLVGFDDASYFSRVFKNLTGYAPSDCREAKKF